MLVDVTISELIQELIKNIINVLKLEYYNENP